MTSLPTKGKRSASPSNTSTESKKARKECMYGVKCFRKNPEHFKDFAHKHLDEILSKQTDSKKIILPTDFDTGLKRTAPSLILEQVSIVRDLQKSRREDGVSTSPACGENVENSSQVQQKPFSNNVEPQKQSRSKDSDGKTSLDGDPSSERAGQSGSRPDRAELECMAREATKHHGDVQAKLDAAAPYYFFLSSIADSPQTHQEPLTITFTELLDKTLGQLECSLQINYMVELGWLLAQYFYTGNRFKPLTLLYGVENEDLNESTKLPSNLTAVKIKTNAFGHHHTKMSVIAYKDESIRVIVSTANLVESDWENRTQGLWVSPRLPALSDDADTTAGESPTQFKADLLRYLSFYRLPQLQEWLRRVRRADFSSVKVCLVASVPGTHYGPELHLWGHRRMLSLLKSNVEDPKDPRRPWNSWPVIGQFSSIGTLGNSPNEWVCGELQNSFSAPAAKQEVPPIKLIYPSFNNVKESHDNLLGGACLPYQQKTHQKQIWLTDLLHQWRSDGRYRSRAVPHIKSYARVSPCSGLLSWFLLTSANLSKAAWGSGTKAMLPGQGLRILSFEVGVLFLPKYIVEDVAFNLEVDGISPSESSKSVKGTGNRHDYPPFPLHYDIPLVKYKPDDTPWFYDILLER